ncbi:MAG: GNAT family N-acetyltransferase [bacterium]
MNSAYRIRRAESSEDGARLHQLFSEVFYPEDVGTFAETLFHHLPGMKKENWFIAEEKKSATIVSAFALIPWVWEIEGNALKVAEMGIVGTKKEHRHKGLMKKLYEAFHATLVEEQFDLSMIQGIPGFYHQFGYYYSIPLENNITLSTDTLPTDPEKEVYRFRRAGLDDIIFLMEEDTKYRRFYSISVKRDKENWRYLLTHSLKTEYGSDFWIMENKDNEQFYFRIPHKGFGNGLIVSEVSEHIHYDALVNLLLFCKKKAIERNKPYIRLNIHNGSTAGTMAISMGAQKGIPYAWQIKVPNIPNFLQKITTILEKRVRESCCENFSETLRLDFYKSKIDILWNKGRIMSIEPGTEAECPNTFCMSEDLFPALCLGHRSWHELQYVRPDIFPAPQYIMPDPFSSSDKSGLVMDILFPRSTSWIYEQY